MATFCLQSVSQPVGGLLLSVLNWLVPSQLFFRSPIFSVLPHVVIPLHKGNLLKNSICYCSPQMTKRNEKRRNVMRDATPPPEATTVLHLSGSQKSSKAINESLRMDCRSTGLLPQHHKVYELQF
uniref:Uncharacterized protein n=1 Tax=Stomoxys calcitrans TaxID=35570 RepID=A0A1I8P2N3_STOCA